VSVWWGQLFNFLKPLNNLDSYRTDIDLKILDTVSLTKKFVKDNPDILFTRADKGNTVVALDRDDYLNKMKTYLSDSDIYIRLKHDPAKKLLDDLKILLKRWSSLKYVSSHSYWFLNTSNAILPRAYGLPKIHKIGYPASYCLFLWQSTAQFSLIFTQNSSRKSTTIL